MIHTLIQVNQKHRVCVLPSSCSPLLHLVTSCISTHLNSLLPAGKHRSRSSFTIHSPSSEADTSRLEVVTPWADRTGPGTGFSPPPSLLKTVAAAARRGNPNLNPAPGKENIRSSASTSSASRKENISGTSHRENAHGHQRTPSAKGQPSQSRLPAVVQPFKCAFHSFYYQKDINK